MLVRNRPEILNLRILRSLLLLFFIHSILGSIIWRRLPKQSKTTTTTGAIILSLLFLLPFCYANQNVRLQIPMDLLVPSQREEGFLIFSSLASFRWQRLSFTPRCPGLGFGGRIDGLNPLVHLLVIFALEEILAAIRESKKMKKWLICLGRKGSGSKLRMLRSRVYLSCK